jgi:hypothetical protein
MNSKVTPHGHPVAGLSATMGKAGILPHNLPYHLDAVETASSDRVPGHCDTIALAVIRKSNPYFSSGRTPHLPCRLVTEFERQMRQLRLSRETCIDSRELRRWCVRNRNRCYIPEWLLEKWGITVEPGNS